MNIFAMFVSSFLLLVVGCGAQKTKNEHQAPPHGTDNDGQEKKKSDTNANASKSGENKSNLLPSCDNQWAAMVAQNVVGNFTVYETTSKSSPADEQFVTVTIMRQEVTAVSDQEITWKHHTETNGRAVDSVSSLTKAKFLKSCSANENKPTEQKPTGEGDEVITVKAGTFQTHWMQFADEKEGRKTTTKIWLYKGADGTGFAVKTEMTSVAAEGSFSAVTELVSRNR